MHFLLRVLYRGRLHRAWRNVHLRRILLVGCVAAQRPALGVKSKGERHAR